MYPEPLFFLNLPPVPSENARQSQWYNKSQLILISFYQQDKNINLMTVKIMSNQLLQCQLRKVHCQFYNKNRNILKILCPQARRHSQYLLYLLYFYILLKLQASSGLGVLGMIWGGSGPWGVAWHDFCIRFVSGFHSWLARAGLMIQ